MNLIQNTSRLLAEYRDNPAAVAAILLLVPPLLTASLVATALDRWLCAR
jgi:hypothetical protein